MTKRVPKTILNGPVVKAITGNNIKVTVIMAINILRLSTTILLCLTDTVGGNYIQSKYVRQVSLCVHLVDVSALFQGHKRLSLNHLA